MSVTIDIDILCPNKLCSDNVYSNFVLNYLVNSTYSETEFSNLLDQIPTMPSYVLGKVLFTSLISAIDSFRKYKNYKFLSTTNTNSAKNYDYLIKQNKKIFNDIFDKLPDLKAKRLLVFSNLITTIDSMEVVTDLYNSSTTYEVSSDPNIRLRLNYIKQLVVDSENVFINLVNSYIANFDNAAIA